MTKTMNVITPYNRSHENTTENISLAGSLRIWMKNWFLLKEIFTILDLDITDNTQRTNQNLAMTKKNNIMNAQNKSFSKVSK